MAKPDAGLRATMRSYLGHIGQWVSIETGLTEQGVADLNVCIRAAGREVWIECKYTSGFAVTFRPAQVGWLFTRWRYGGNAIIATRRITRWKDPKVNVDELYLTSGGLVRELERDGLARVGHLLVCSGGPERWPWNKIEHVLRHGR